MNKWLISGFIIIVFLSGVYMARIANTGQYGRSSTDFKGEFSPNQILLYIEEKPITMNDVDWEYQLHALGLENREDLTPIPATDLSLDEELIPLKKELAATLIERMLLYKFIQRDGSFDINNSARYTSCLEDWQKTIQELPASLKSQTNSEKLKSYLCEKSILEQYLKEKIFSEILVTEDEIRDYFIKNQSKFYEPTKALIRQVVLASEKEGRKIKRKINRDNFEYYAKTNSITPEAARGGLLGPFAKGELPRVFDIAFTMRTGEIRGVIKSTYGFHIIKLERKYKARKLSIAQARLQIKEKLTEQKKHEEYQKWVELALNEVPIKSPKSYW